MIFILTKPRKGQRKNLLKGELLEDPQERKVCKRLDGTTLE